jgi:ATP-dependent Lon protease
MVELDALDTKLNHVFPGKVVRKDLLLQVKKGTNVPSFVLEFLLARFCASDDPQEIQMGFQAVLETIQNNYVRPDESNKAQIKVQSTGKHTFIDKIHVKYNERQKRTWANMENFNSQMIAINERFYKDENDRIFEGGIWAEVTVGHNDVEEDDYSFFVDKLSPIQLSRFDFNAYVNGRQQFSRDEWLDVIVRSFGLEPSWMTQRIKFHYLARLAPLVESNFNFIELGPRGNGKSYTFSEFSPYSTLLGAPTSAASLWWNNSRRKVGIIGFWDVVAFDEVGEGVVVRDKETFQVMKQYMANGNFTRSNSTVTANASMAFIGNIDDSIESVVNSPYHTLFKPLHSVFDLAILDRFHTFLPGWEIPKNKDENLTKHYGMIVEYLAEAFHHLARKSNRYAWVKANAKLGPGFDQRDQTAVLKMTCALVKMLHPGENPSQEEFNEYLAYAIEGRRRVKEQLNKRKPDDEFAQINLGYYNTQDELTIVYCPESQHAQATQNPVRGVEVDADGKKSPRRPVAKAITAAVLVQAVDAEHAAVAPVADVEREPQEKHYRIHYNATGHSYENIFADYLPGADVIEVEDAYIRANHQVSNFVRFCETAIKLGKPSTIHLYTKFDIESERVEAMAKLDTLKQSLLAFGVNLQVTERPSLHDRQVRLSNGWVIKIGRGFDIYQRPNDWFQIGATDMELRACLETTVDIFRVK